MDVQKGVVLVLSGPSGSGKGTILSKIRDKNKDITVSISATTRLPRVGEQEGKHYFFKTSEHFEALINQGEFLEWVKYCDNYYGTPKSFVMDNINIGKDIIIEVEVEGALNIKKNYPECVLVFVMPPSFEELVNRISKRGTETEESLSKRMNIAIKEINESKHYDYIILNDKLDKAIKSFNSILEAEKHRIRRNEIFVDSILKEGMTYERSYTKNIVNDHTSS